MSCLKPSKQLLLDSSSNAYCISLKRIKCFLNFVILSNNQIYLSLELSFQVLLPNRDVITISLKKSANTDEVYDAVVKKINMSLETSKYFYLFEIVEYNFGECRCSFGIERILFYSFGLFQSVNFNVTRTLIICTFRTTALPPVPVYV